MPTQILVTGDKGQDIFERIVPSKQIDDRDMDYLGVPRDIAFRINVPSGAGLIHEALRSLLPNREFKPVLKSYPEPLNTYHWRLQEFRKRSADEPVRRIAGASVLEVVRDNSRCPINSMHKQVDDVPRLLDYLVIHDAARSWKAPENPAYIVDT